MENLGVADQRNRFFLARVSKIAFVDDFFSVSVPFVGAIDLKLYHKVLSPIFDVVILQTKLRPANSQSIVPPQPSAKVLSPADAASIFVYTFPWAYTRGFMLVTRYADSILANIFLPVYTVTLSFYVCSGRPFLMRSGLGMAESDREIAQR